MKLKEVIQIALEAGEILLRSGAETYRVEESITKICTGYGHSCETFVLPTGIFLTVHSPREESQTFIRRIRIRSINNMDRIDRINSFSRDITEHPLSYGEALQELERIKSSDIYPALAKVLSASLMAFAFTILFGGGIIDALIAAGIGLVVYLMNLRMLKSGYFPYLVLFVLGFVSGLLSMASELLYIGGNTFIIIISSVFLYLPGVAMTSGIRDILAGDTVSGLTRLGEAVLTVTAIGMGVGLVISMSHYFFR